MLEKIEPPTSIPPGYGISVAYATLLDIVRSISLAIQGPSVVSFGDFEGNRDLICFERVAVREGYNPEVPV